MVKLHALQIEPIITQALAEDWGHGDLTTSLCVPVEVHSKAIIIAKEDLIVAGIDVAQHTFRLVDQQLAIDTPFADGTSVKMGQTIMVVDGRSQSILQAERVALNFLGMMCGIATLTRAFVDRLQGTKVQLLDTRKTTPGLRLLEKHATAAGGARNHRFGLSDGILVKENHIRAAGSIAKALASLRNRQPATLNIEVEATSLDEVQQALDAGADMIMLDNMALDEMNEAVRYIDQRAIVEASGGVTLDKVRQIAETGVDFVSAGAIVHSARWSDLSLLFDANP